MNTRICSAAALAFSALSVSCGFHPFEMSVEVLIPPVPPGAAACVEPGVRLKVDSEEAGGIDISARAGETRKLRLPKAQVTVLTAEYEGGVPPAGAVLPYDARSDARLELSFEQGFCAAVFTRLAEAGMPLPVVNYQRLISECSLRSEGNPFVLDQERIFRALLAGSFSIRDIVMLQEYRLPPGALPPGTWVPANPLAPDLTGGEEAQVFQGRWSYYCDGEAAVLWCDSMGWFFYALDGNFSRSGLW